MNTFQKILAGIGGFGLLLLTPVIFYTFGNTAPIDFINSYVGGLGDPSVLTFVSFCMIGLMVFLGGGKNMSATLISMLLGFLLISTAVEIGFLQWFKDLVTPISFMSNLKLNLLTGVAILLFGMFLSYAEKVKLWIEVLALLVFPVGFLVGANQMDILPNNPEFDISLDKGMEALTQMIDKKYLNNPNVKEYVEEVHENEDLSEEEKVQKMEELQGKINKLEDEEKTLADLRAENEKYKNIIKSQTKKLKEYAWCAGSRDSSSQVKSLAEAVVPNQPCVRDFSVSLVKEEAGPYYDYQRGVPGKKGLKQICNLHYHLSTNWKYVSDPTMIRDDYYSPANRTISLGLGGDCDDFAVLNASCVEAIGGISRIMAGFCAGGGHGWAEVFIGGKNEWNKAVKIIRDHYDDPSKVLKPNIDKNGAYWLPLDWNMGQFSCNSQPNKMMELYTSKEQFTKK